MDSTFTATSSASTTAVDVEDHGWVSDRVDERFKLVGGL
jgi:hypothetical protein